MYIEGNSDISAQMARNLTMLKKLILPKRTKCAGEKGQKAGAQEYYQDGKKIPAVWISCTGNNKKAGYRDWLERTCQAFLL